MWYKVTSAIDDSGPKLCRTVVIGIEQNEYPAATFGLGRSEPEILQEILIPVQKAVAMHPNGFLHIGITIRVNQPRRCRNRIGRAITSPCPSTVGTILGIDEIALARTVGSQQVGQGTKPNATPGDTLVLMQDESI